MKIFPLLLVGVLASCATTTSSAPPASSLHEGEGRDPHWTKEVKTCVCPADGAHVTEDEAKLLDGKCAECDGPISCAVKRDSGLHRDVAPKPEALSWQIPLEAPLDLAAMTPPLDLIDRVPALGPAFSKSFTVACGTTATTISTSAQISYTCQNPSTTAVAVGSTDIGDPSSGQNSPTYCATNCPSQEWGGNIRQESCRVHTGTVTIYCRAMVAASSAP